MMKRLVILIFAFFYFNSCSSSNLNQRKTITGYLNENIAENTLPAINGWLYYKNNTFADWLGIKYHNKILREPINVIIIDSYSTSTSQAVKKLMKECKIVGYEEEYGHSSGYMGFIDNKSYYQIPNNRHMAFANKDFLLTNNHGRIIGPAFYNNRYIFIAGFSTEKPTIFKGIKHLFISFDKARDDFSLKLNESNVYKIIGSVDFANSINTESVTTADHDGKVIVLEAQE